MFKIIELIKSLFKKVPYTKEQKELFDKIKVGDIIYGKLPLSPEQEKLIEKSHLYRPFLVVKKGKNEVTTYVFSSVKRKKVHTYDFYKQPFLFDKNSKPSYVYLNDIQRLPIENIFKIIKHMNEETLMTLDKRLYIASCNGHSRPRFNVKLTPERGDVVRCNNQLYLVVSRGDEKVIANKVVDVLSEEYDVIVIKNRGNVYPVKYMIDEILDINSGLVYVDIISMEEVKRIRLKASKEKEINNSFYFRLPMGYTFSLGMNNYLYLYHKGKSCYGICFDDEEFDCRVFRINNFKYMKKGKRLDKEEVKYVMSEIIESGNDVHNVIKQIIKRM